MQEVGGRLGFLWNQRMVNDFNTLENKQGGKEYSFPQLPDSVRKILELGGLAAYLKAQLNAAP